MNDESEALCLAATWKNDGTMEQDHTFETGIGTISLKADQGVRGILLHVDQDKKEAVPESCTFNCSQL